MNTDEPQEITFEEFKAKLDERVNAMCASLPDLKADYECPEDEELKMWYADWFDHLGALDFPTTPSL